LLGKGDMLYMSSANRIVRIHAPFVSDGEIEQINNFLRSQAEPYANGRDVGFADEKEIKYIVDKVMKDNYSFKTVIQEIIYSPSFYKKKENWLSKLF